MGLDVTYKGQQIAQLTEDGNLTLETAGKYCEDDIELAYSEGLIDYTNSGTQSGYGMSWYAGMKRLRRLIFPNYSLIIPGRFCFGCSALEEVRMPKVASSQNALNFAGCTALKIADLGNISNLASQMFMNCIVLKKIVLRRNAIVPLTYMNMFDQTPFASGGSGGTVYVPSDLISTYQTETNWSSLYMGGSVTFVAIEGSEFE